MSKTRILGFLGSLSLLLAIFVVLPGLGADERNKDGKDGLYRPLGLFTEVLTLVRSNYVEQVELKPLLSGAFAGMTEAMDPFSEYIPPERMSAFSAAEAAREKRDVVDTGIVLARRFGYPVVVAAIAGSPAAAAGVRSDDVIEKIDDTPARALPLWEAEAKLSGKPGGRVRLLVVREGKPRRKTIEVLRASWTPATPSAERIEGETLIRIPDFAPGTAAALKAMLATYDRTKPLLLDLRSNALGSFDEAARAAALFVAPGALGELKGRKIQTKTFRAEPGERVHDGRTVLLVDSGTAGAAELFAAALRESAARGAASKARADRKSGAAEEEPGDENPVPEGVKNAGPVRLVGEPTFGMGFTAQVVRLSSGGSLRISVAKIHTVSGRALSPKGIEPDDRVFPLPPDESNAHPPADPVLQRGLKVLAEPEAPAKIAA